jgi:hypothetical protein
MSELSQKPWRQGAETRRRANKPVGFMVSRDTVDVNAG